jgi:hypothetical protein
MKTTMISLASLYMLFSFIPKDVNYEAAMLKTISILQEASNVEEMQKAAHQFERIAQAENTKWLPPYYAAYAYITMGAMEEEKAKKDQYLDQAQVLLNDALQLQEEESELIALQGYLHMIRLSVDPANRGQQLAPKATQLLTQATEVNPENPRALMLLGQMQFGSAQFFGTDITASCALIDKSIALYENQSQSKETLMPSWGLHIAQAYQEYCNK